LRLRLETDNDLLELRDDMEAGMLPALPEGKVPWRMGRIVGL